MGEIINTFAQRLATKRALEAEMAEFVAMQKREAEAKEKACKWDFMRRDPDQENRARADVTEGPAS